MEKHIGLDMHSTSCTLAVLSGTGRRLQQSVVDTNARELCHAVRSLKGSRNLCTEEGTHSDWIYEILEPWVDEIVVTCE